MSSELSTETDSSVTGSASTSFTPSTSFTDTGPSFTRPTFTPTRTRGFDGGGGNGNGIGSSAASSLYLYTFLATLVLLLLISGAVLARTIRLRMRARRALEESIRNGTYVPRIAGVSAPDAPKPKFHDAHINDKDDSSLMDEKHSQWANLVPVTAAFIPSRTSRPLPQPATSAPPRTGVSLGARLRNLNPFRAVQVQDIVDELASRDSHSRPTSQQPPQPSQGELAAVAFGSSPANDENDDQQVLARPSAVRVVVLIAMPDPARPTRTSDDSSSSSSAKGKTPASGSGMTSDDEGEVPYVEFGVAEVSFASTARSRSEFSPTPPSSLPPSSPPRAS